MSLLWLFFASLTVVGSTLYNFSVKSAGEVINPFIFTVLLTLFALLGHLTALFINKGFFNTELNITATSTGVGLAFLAGLGVVIIDLAYFYSVKLGGLTVSNTFWTVGSLVLVVALGILFFNEQLSLYKTAGLILGIISIFLLTRP